MCFAAPKDGVDPYQKALANKNAVVKAALISHAMCLNALLQCDSTLAEQLVKHAHDTVTYTTIFEMSVPHYTAVPLALSDIQIATLQQCGQYIQDQNPIDARALDAVVQYFSNDADGHLLPQAQEAILTYDWGSIFL